MSTKDRKEREKEEMRELILATANEIIAKEGTEKLSIRKIASNIEYSPSIIYHYFKDKDEIVSNLMSRGYKKIITALSSSLDLSDNPKERLRNLTRRYIETALQMPDEFMAVQLSTSRTMLEHTSSLFRGASRKKPALNILYDCLKDIYKDKKVDEDFLELTAQIIAASSFGIIIKLIIEKDIGQEQINRIIEHYIKCTIDGMILENSLSNL